MSEDREGRERLLPILGLLPLIAHLKDFLSFQGVSWLLLSPLIAALCMGCRRCLADRTDDAPLLCLSLGLPALVAFSQMFLPSRVHPNSSATSDPAAVFLMEEVLGRARRERRKGPGSCSPADPGLQRSRALLFSSFLPRSRRCGHEVLVVASGPITDELDERTAIMEPPKRHEIWRRGEVIKDFFLCRGRGFDQNRCRERSGRRHV